MIIFKILLVILLAAPVIGLAAFLFVKARNYSVNLNRNEKYTNMFRDRREEFFGRK